MSDSKKFELDRRSLLKTILVGTGLSASGGFNTFLTTMMTSFMQKANAQAAGVDPAFEEFKLISIVLANGAPRYYWDLPLKPNDNDPFSANAMCATEFFKDGNGYSTRYATTKINGINMSSIWNANIPTIIGGVESVVSMKNLAQNMLIMRGLDLQIDSHEIDRYRQLAPVPGDVSLTGLLADVSNTPIPAVGRNGGGQFYKGQKGIAHLDLTDGNPLSTALSPFSLGGQDLLAINKAGIESAIDQALLRMEASAKDKGKFLPSTYSARYNAKKMMLREFGNLQTAYTSLVTKYRDLIRRAFNPTGDLILNGVDNFEIGSSRTDRQQLTEGILFDGTDLRTLTGRNPLNNNATTIAGLAEGLAIVEFMVTQGLSSALNIRADNIANGFFESTYQKSNRAIVGQRSTAISVDAHFLGTEPAIIIFSRYYRAISACLYELVRTLKNQKLHSGQTLFDKTLISVTSEFNRLPRSDGSGADHGWQGSNYTVLSGMIDELMVVGNVKSNGDNRGTWGLAAPLAELNSREPIIGNAASTVANILEIKTPTPNDMSFTKKENGKVKLAIKSLKNVA